MAEKNYTLSELTSHITEVLKVNFDSPLWIRAEISELREHSNGHCYLELIEKDKHSDQIIAKIRANIWANTFRVLKVYFEDNTGQSLRAGMSVLVAVTVEFHDVFGISLNIRDIDPTYTLGDLSARRQQIIKQLEADGVIEMNKQLQMPLLTRRIAIISSATAAGYEDFCNQLDNNQEGFVFYHQLFPALMQGDQAEQSIIMALEKVFDAHHLFDVVVIIRGGGATTDLACYDGYELALNCAQFPLPVISGIGHQRDITILDLVAHMSVKTPTAAAAYLIDCLSDAYQMASVPYDAVISLVRNKLQGEERRLSDIQWKMKHALQQKSSARHLQLEKMRAGLQASIRMAFSHHRSKLDLIESKLEKHSPAFMLKFGYSITTLNGKRITSVEQAGPGAQIRTWLTDGSIDSTVNQNSGK
jgi:exodeoxyribonuclease VII large subunit